MAKKKRHHGGRGADRGSSVESATSRSARTAAVAAAAAFDDAAAGRSWNGIERRRRRSAAAAGRKRKRGGGAAARRRADGGSNGEHDGDNEGGGMMDEIRAQLERQRARARAEAHEAAAYSECSAAVAPNGRNGGDGGTARRGRDMRLFAENAAQSSDGDGGGGGANANAGSANRIKSDNRGSNKKKKKKRPPRVMGRYRYDPVRRAYFPTDEPYVQRPVGWNDNDEAGNNGSKPAARKASRRRADRDKQFDSLDAAATAVEAAALTLSRCSLLRCCSLKNETNNGSAAYAWKNQSWAAHAYQMAFEITASSGRRSELRSEWAAAIVSGSGSGGVRVVPTVRRIEERRVRAGVVVNGPRASDGSASDRIEVEGERERAAAADGSARQGYADRNASSTSLSSAAPSSALPAKTVWASMLQPFLSHSQAIRYDSASDPPFDTPFDCACKHHLHPSARTFDVAATGLTNGGGAAATTTSATLPHVATITGDAASQVHYRLPEFRERAYVLDGVRPWGDATSCVLSRPDFQYQAVRFAPFELLDGTRPFGVIFCRRSGPGVPLQSCFKLSLPGGMLERFGRFYEPEFTDFAFSPGSSISALGTVAFASNQRSEGNMFAPHFIDLTTYEISELSSCRWKFASDMNCVEYMSRDCPDTILYGHRNGAVSVLDYRSASVMYTCRPNRRISGAAWRDDAFGSVNSLLPLGDGNFRHGNPHSFVAKGSFGSLHLYDIRKLGDDPVPKAKVLSSPSLVRTMTIPSDLISQTSPTGLSTSCSGMVVDPSGSTLISPFVSAGKGPCLGMWSLATGKFMKEIRLISDLASRVAFPVASPQGGGDGSGTFQGPSYCELASTITPAWDLDLNDGDDMAAPALVQQAGSFGVWLKCDALLGAPREVGAIHHVSFPVSLY